VKAVLKGEIWVARNLIPHLVKELNGAAASEEKALPKLFTDFSHLRPREREIAQMIGAGGSNKEIANRLKITEATVKAHLTSIFRTFGFSSRVRLALLVERNRHFH
jgi:DNA-binding NarL/FixJ family response regulator